MAIAKAGRTVTFTAVNEGIDLTTFGHPFVEVVGMTFQGASTTAGHRVVVRDHKTPGSGNPLADYLIEGTSDNADLWGGRQPQIVSGLSIDNNTVGGTWVLTVSLLV